MARHVLDLGGDDWRLGRAPEDADPHRACWRETLRITDWVPARVPGNVRADLSRCGLLPDLLKGLNSRDARWPDDHCWWLVREFDLPIQGSRRSFVVLRGVDYIWDLYLNGEHLGRHEGMFSPVRREITEILQERNRLAVRITGSRWLPRDRSSPWEKVLNRIEARLGGLPGTYPDRRDTLKCQMGFGWDFAPGLRTMGIWDDVFIVQAGRAVIGDVVTAQQIQAGAALQARVQVDAHPEGGYTLRCRLEGETFASEPVLAETAIAPSAGPGWHEIGLSVAQPRLWWTWDLGEPDLYRLTVELLDGDRVLDRAEHCVGFRDIALDNWTLRVNGHRLFARGANWVPADILPGRVRRSAYEALLAQARRAHINTLRVWGGGLREKRDFYDLCDRLGLLVWQDFPFACAVLTRFPRTPAYLKLVEAEARAIVRDLREHPCLFLWCGGNEYSQRRNRPLVSALQQAVSECDPRRPFLPASPSGGDSHDWRVWHHLQPPAAYRSNEAPFASEFGLQSPPDPDSLRDFIPDEDMWPAGPSWEYHGAELNKLWRYARPFLARHDRSLAGFVEASQRAQAHGLQIALEHFRRRKASGCGGALLWQLNEPWPAISWSLIGFDGRPKPAYNRVRRCQSPVLVSICYPLQPYRDGQRLNGTIWIVNDRAEGLEGCRLEVVLRDAGGAPVERGTWRVDVPPDSASVFAEISWVLPPGGGWRLQASLAHAGVVVSENAYDLAIHDAIQPRLVQRLRAWLVGLVSPWK